MKIVIAISHSFCANFIRGQAAFLKKKGHEVIIVSAPGPEVTKLAINEDVRLVEIPFSREISLVKDIRGLAQVIKFLKKERPNLVNAGNPKTGFLFTLASLFFPSIPTIFTLRGLRSDTLTGIKKKIVFFTEWLSCFLAKRVIVISPSLREHAVQIGVLNISKAIVIGKGSSNGVDVNKFQSSLDSYIRGKALRNKFGVSENDLVIGHVGRITRDKGIEELYKAFKICRAKNPSIKLFLAGPIEEDDPILPEIMSEMKTNEDVFFLGKQSDVTGVYSAYDILILYSYREGFGNVALEASSMGKPVIVADIPGARDTTEHMKSGLHVEPKNANELSISIQFYIDNPHLRNQHGEYGAQRAREFFSSEVIWNGQSELYNQLVNE